MSRHGEIRGGSFCSSTYWLRGCQETSVPSGCVVVPFFGSAAQVVRGWCYRKEHLWTGHENEIFSGSHALGAACKLVAAYCTALK